MTDVHVNTILTSLQRPARPLIIGCFVFIIKLKIASLVTDGQTLQYDRDIALCYFTIIFFVTMFAFTI